MRLSDRALRHLRYEGKLTKIFDDALPNFGVRIYPNRVSFIVMMGNGRQMKTIGKYPQMSLKVARQEAVRLLTGEIPHPSRMTVAEARDAFIEHAKVQNKPRTVADYTRLLNKHLPIGKLRDLSRETLLKKLDGLSNVPSEQFHAGASMKTFLNWCVGKGYITHNPLLGIRQIGKITHRDRILTDDELKRIYQTAQTQNPPYGTIVQLLILTGLRKNEVVALQPEWIVGNVLTIPGSHVKNSREHRLPIGSLTAPLFADLPLTFNGWSKSKKRLDNAAEVYDWTLHDLRRTFASNHARLGTPIHVVEKLLNHVSGSFGGVAGVYNRYSYFDEMAEATKKFDDWFLKYKQN